MSTHSNVSGSIHKWHELALKFEQAGGTQELLQKVIDSPGNMKARKIVGFLAGNENPFKLPKPPTDEGEAWKVFYEHFFDMEVEPHFPKKSNEFPWGVYIPKGVTEDQVITVSRQYYPVEVFGYDTIAEAQVKNLRNIGGVGIRLRARVEADKENKNKSAEDLENKGHIGISLIEYLILHLFHWWKTGEHLDEKNVTVCSGSRDADGDVPGVDWYAASVRVCWGPPSFADSLLRSRSVSD